jgi:hypothetical protein
VLYDLDLCLELIPVLSGALLWIWVPGLDLMLEIIRVMKLLLRELWSILFVVVLLVLLPLPLVADRQGQVLGKLLLKVSGGLCLSANASIRAMSHGVIRRFL